MARATPTLSADRLRPAITAATLAPEADLLPKLIEAATDPRADGAALCE